LIKLLRKFKIFIDELINENTLNSNNNGNFISLKAFYEEVENKLIDNDYFHCLLGNNFDDKCNPIVEEFVCEEQ
jgi:hypothetical protein